MVTEVKPKCLWISLGTIQHVGNWSCWTRPCLFAALGTSSLIRLSKGTNGPNSHNDGAVCKECSSPPPSSSSPGLYDLSWQTEWSNIFSLGPHRLFPQGEVIGYSATCDACLCAWDVARDASLPSPIWDAFSHDRKCVWLEKEYEMKGSLNWNIQTMV